MLRFSSPVQNEAGRWSFTILGINEDVITESQAFDSKEECQKAVTRLELELQGVTKKEIRNRLLDLSFQESQARLDEEKKEFIKKKIEVLQRTGLDNLANELLEAHKMELPNAKRLVHEFCSHFWQYRYQIGIIELIKHKEAHELGRLLRQIEAKADWELRKNELPGDDSFRPSGIEQPISIAPRRPKQFESREEFFEELIKFIQERIDSGYLSVHSFGYEMDYLFIFEDFLRKNVLKGEDISRQDLKNWVLTHALDRFHSIFEGLSTAKKEAAIAFLSKNDETLVDELMTYFEEEENRGAIFDRSPQGRRNAVLERFWLTRYPQIDKVAICDWKRITIHRLLIGYDLKVKEAEKRINNLILTQFIEWANVHSINKVDSTEERAFLREQNLLDTPHRFQAELLRDVNFRIANGKVNGK